MHSLTQELKARGLPARTGPDVERLLQEAMQATFSGNATRTEAEIALVQIIHASGYFGTTRPEATPEQVMWQEGRRSLAMWILQYLGPAFAGELFGAVCVEANAADGAPKGA